MESLFNQLKQIEEILKQIATITENQTTVLLQTTNEDLEETMSLLETMVDYKETLIDELESLEKEFDMNYKSKREQVASREYAFKFKESVSRILNKKQEIQATEQNNVQILQSKEHRKVEKIEIAKKPNEAVVAYKKQQMKF